MEKDTKSDQSICSDCLNKDDCVENTKKAIENGELEAIDMTPRDELSELARVAAKEALEGNIIKCVDCGLPLFAHQDECPKCGKVETTVLPPVKKTKKPENESTIVRQARNAQHAILAAISKARGVVELSGDEAWEIAKEARDKLIQWKKENGPMEDGKNSKPGCATHNDDTNGPCRESTLAEYVDQLPEDHRAHQEMVLLLKEVSDRTEEVKKKAVHIAGLEITSNRLAAKLDRISKLDPNEALSRLCLLNADLKKESVEEVLGTAFPISDKASPMEDTESISADAQRRLNKEVEALLQQVEKRIKKMADEIEERWKVEGDVKQLQEGTTMSDEMAKGIAKHYREQDRIRKEAPECQEGVKFGIPVLPPKGRTRLCFYRYKLVSGHLVIVPVRIYSDRTLTIGYKHEQGKDPVKINDFDEAMKGAFLPESVLLPVL